MHSLNLYPRFKLSLRDVEEHLPGRVVLERARSFIRLLRLPATTTSAPTTPSTASHHSRPREKPAPRDWKGYWR
ncbi:MAG: hypothetical protein ACTSRV_11875 [Candidatus Freyarchaeota archaeon]